MKDRPELDPRSGKYAIVVKNSDDVALIDENHRNEVRELIYGLCEPMLKGHPRCREIEPLFKKGRWHFLFDNDGNFQSDSVEMTPTEN